ncbi:uncharacterized protein BP5553_04251 [Venustampulla echinocandica]|uniref:P-loop containing nucleoside triphosphate hydrolase n=1 Tax=Venustampulla echinocandica TaxID=2656787 RepID=A0A370TWL2_9HELO|nr:uncharacterized protein BP5553_04251 [Venustampulla echinocandica]RDL39911.1 hypothetical protein BP5553_04251 [Venustampulla echinocandica]
MQSLISSLAGLAATISLDRHVHVDFKEAILNAHVAGDGFIDKSVESEDEDMDDAEQTDSEPSLFVGDGETGGAAIDGDSGGEDVEIEDPEDTDITECDEIMQWLKGLGDHINGLHQTPTAGRPTPCPHLAIEPKAYQYAALAKIEYNSQSPLQGLLLGDPPGLGKTLPAMMAVVKAMSTAKRFSIVVVPASCVAQWSGEFAKFFQPDTVRVLVLRDPNISPLELTKYDVVLVSYAFVMSQYRKLCDYYHAVNKYKSNGGGGGKDLERPSLSIFSDIFSDQEGVKSPYLVLDEATAVKNSESMTFAAINELRGMAHACLMLSGSPMDNTWMDSYSYAQLLKGHDIRSKSVMRALFASKAANGRLTAPRGVTFLRFIQLLNSFIVRRPEDSIELPPLTEEVFKFSLNVDEESISNYNYKKHRGIQGMNSKDAVRLGGKKALQPWGYLTRALQHAMHPALVLIMHLMKPATRNDQAAADQLFEKKEIEEWTAWRETLTHGDKWKSSRIIALVDVFNKRRDLEPDCGVLVFDESVYFLDIVQIAFESMYDPIRCIRYDGRTDPERRAATLADFEKADGPKVMLISRGAGGIGLNIPAANVVIICGPWWKCEWERQAIKRSHRPGQWRPVWVFRLLADNCNVDKYKAGLRDRKERHNSRINTQITRKDGVMPQVWDDLD